MDKQYLKENGLYNAHKQFMRLCEWSYSPSGLDEDDEAPQDPNMDATAQNMGDQNNMGAAAPQDGQGFMDGGMNNGMQSGQDQNMGMDDQNMENPSMSDDMPNGDMMPDIPEPSTEDNEEDDDVIDVDDLTDAQEKMNKKVNHVGKDVSSMDNRINQLMTALDKMESMINSNNDKIEQLNAEFKARVQTPTEKLNLRSLDSYPFNVKPTEYWAKVTKDMPQYSVTDDNDIPTEKEYVIKQSDVDNVPDKEIEDSFIIDDKFRQDINKIFGL
jgi:hypothetical protein